MCRDTYPCGEIVLTMGKQTFLIGVYCSPIVGILYLNTIISLYAGPGDQVDYIFEQISIEPLGFLQWVSI